MGSDIDRKGSDDQLDYYLDVDKLGWRLIERVYTSRLPILIDGVGE